MDRHLVALGLVALFGCTPRPTAALDDTATETPTIRKPEKTDSNQTAETAKTRWVDVSVESEFGCAVERTGAVYCWGRGPAAEMGLRELPPQPTPDPMAYGVRKWGPASRLDLVDDARAVSTATGLGCAIVDGGRVRCWGSFRWGTQHVYDVPGVAKAVALEIGDGESCATLESGELWCWGADDFGIPRARLGGTVAVSVSDSIACGLGQQGDVVCWGQGIEDWHRYDKQFNQQQPPNPFGTPPDVEEDFPDSLEVGRFRGAVDLALTGWNTLCVLRGDGRVVCSDRDVFALLRGEELGMREIDGASGIAELNATRSHTCARTHDGRALCWGRNVYGQLGDGSSLTREQAAPVAQLSGVVDLSVAEDFSCALTRDDRISCWGFDRGEALGREEFHIHTVEGMRASSIAAAGHMTCAVDELKQLRCWGAESIETVGIAGVAKPTPVDIPNGSEVLGFTSGWESCFLLSSGSLQCGNWTTNSAGQNAFVPTLATPDVRAMVNTSPPACTITGTGRKAQLNCGQSFGQLESETRLKEPFDISASNMRACVAHSGGKVSCFAEFYYWGDGPRPEREFKQVPGISDAIAVTSGTYHDCALRRDGHVTCWVGRTESTWSEDGRTATAVHYRMADPLDMGLEQIVQVVSGSQHHCALSKSGAVRCWADSPYSEQTVWQTVPELGPDIVELAAGTEHTCARNKAGKVSCWGDDVWGQLGRVPSRVYLTPTAMKVE
jgi:alpha-tubulin suppressor-like RCC1 family protein